MANSTSNGISNDATDAAAAAMITATSMIATPVSDPAVHPPPEAVARLTIPTASGSLYFYPTSIRAFKALVRRLLSPTTPGPTGPIAVDQASTRVLVAWTRSFLATHAPAPNNRTAEGKDDDHESDNGKKKKGKGKKKRRSKKRGRRNNKTDENGGPPPGGSAGTPSVIKQEECAG